MTVANRQESPSTPTASGDGHAEVLRLDGIYKHYPGVQALADVSLSVRRGEVHGLVGENGAGKSTLVGVAASTVRADRGSVEINGQPMDGAHPDVVREAGLAIVFQEPALLPDLTVAENMRLSAPEHRRPAVRDQNERARAILADWRAVADIDPKTYVRDLQPDERFVVAIARAVSEEPAVLVLDEPTEHLVPAGVEELFRLIAEVCRRDGAVVYISHRIHEVKSIADRISVLRDGRLVLADDADNLTEHDIVDSIVGRRLETRFPPKLSPEDLGPEILRVEGLSGNGFWDAELVARQGEIIGLAGIEGQGQREFLRALAGLQRSHGRVMVASRQVRVRNTTAAMRNGMVYLSHDRHREGILPGLNVRENAATAALPKWATAGIVSAGREREEVGREFDALGVKTPSLDAGIETLSGGNQQKVMFSRVKLAASKVLLADEPTQGVDVGARADLYGVLREQAREGSTVIVVSADAAELAGLCDRVAIFSRGRIVEELSGDAVSERAITGAALTATAQRGDHAPSRRATRWPRLRRLAASDFAPTLALIPALIVLALIAIQANEFYLTTRNFSLMLPLVATLAFFGLGQQMVMLNGAIDLSVGPLASVAVVVASYVLTPEIHSVGLALGIVLIFVIGAAVGTLNWVLSTIVRINPLIATLVTFGALQGVALYVRPTPGGQISRGMTDFLKSTIGFMPVTLIVAAALAAACEVAMYRTLLGVRLRASGSNVLVAQKVGVRTKAMSLLSFVAASIFATLGAFMLMAQATSGNALIGNGFTLSSVGAVVLGGASIFGGRGSFLGALFGAGLIIQVNTVVQFRGWDREWQLYLLGGLTILAAAAYSKLRTHRG